MFVVLVYFVIIAHANGAKTGDQFETFCADLKSLMEKHGVEIVVQPTSPGDSDVTEDDISSEAQRISDVTVDGISFKRDEKNVSPKKSSSDESEDDEEKQFLDPDDGFPPREEPEDLYLSSNSDEKTVSVTQDANGDVDVNKDDKTSTILLLDENPSSSKLLQDDEEGNRVESLSQDEECDEEGIKSQLDVQAKLLMRNLDERKNKKEVAGGEADEGAVKTIQEILLDQEDEFLLDEESSAQQPSSTTKGRSPGSFLEENHLFVEKDKKGNSKTVERYESLESDTETNEDVFDHGGLQAADSDVGNIDLGDVTKDQLVRQLYDIINQMKLREN